MLQLVDVASISPAVYEEAVGPAAVEDLVALAAPLQGCRLLHLNATPYGGGVSELLRSGVPLLQGLGIDAEWRVIGADAAFFEVTKGFHNALQGADMPLTGEARDTFLRGNERNARALAGSSYDVAFVHDPQPAAIRHFAADVAKRWIWRCHIDTSRPNPGVWAFLRSFVAEYDSTVFTLAAFVPPDLHTPEAAIIAPAIDPLSPKNTPLPPGLARRILEWVGVRLDRPLMTQVSRFDPWKDPLGVLEVYRKVRTEVPDLQLALVGSMALDDPEAWDIYRAILQESAADPDVHVFTNLSGVSNIEVNAFQSLSDVVIQKSIREGFGLVVSETLWKGTPIVAGRVGGIPMQIPPASSELLIDTTDDAVERVLRLLNDPHQALEHGARGRDWVRKNFLIHRLLADELRLVQRALGLVEAVPSGIGQRRELSTGGRIPNLAAEQ